MATAQYAPVKQHGNWLNRYGVYHRAGPKAAWTLLVHAGTRELARRVMSHLMTTGPSGDWAVAPTDDPPKKPKVW